MALFLTRYFTPTEAAELGGTLWIACGWLALGAVRGWWLWRTCQRFAWKPTVSEIAIWLIVVGNCLSAAIVLFTRTGDGRAALNGAWEWVSLGLMSLLLKDALRASAAPRALMWNLLLLSTLLSGLGIYQHLVWYPRQASDLSELMNLRQKIENGEPLLPIAQRRYDQLSAELGPEVFTLDDSARKMLLARTQFSVEPIGRFALANTLAGLLLIGLFITGEQFWRSLNRDRNWPTRLLLGTCLCLIAACFILTKSRTAMAGLLLAGTWLAAAAIAARRMSRKFLPWGAGLIGVFILLIAGAFAIGGLDWQVLSEAPKSLEYRLEYWRSTWGVITASPLFGVGPGNFRQHYLAFKLPGSSEEILDPHNMVLDAWAHGGLLALAGLMLLIGIWMVRLYRVSFHEFDEPANPHPIGWLGSLAGLVALALVLGEEWFLQGIRDSTLGGLSVGWTAAALVLGGSLRIGICTTPIWLAAGTALLVHLMGAGGFGMPAIFQLLILLVLLTDPPQADSSQPTEMETGTGNRWWRACTILCLLLLLGCFWSSLLPSLAVSSLIDQGRQAMVVTGRIREAEIAFRKAAEADSLAAEPHHQLAALHYTRWVASDRTDTKEFDAAVREEHAALKRDPLGAKRYLLLGTWWLERSEKSKLPGDALEAVNACEAGVKLYPNFAPLRARLAFAIQASGGDPIQEARRALMLDELNWSKQHLDQVLPAAARQRLEKIVRSEPVENSPAK